MKNFACPTCRRQADPKDATECPRCRTDLAPLAALEREFDRCCLRAAYALRAGRLDEAAGELRRASQIHADAPPVHRLSALLALARGNFSGAVLAAGDFS